MWEDVLKVFYSQNKILEVFKKLEQECKDWAEDTGTDMGSANDITSISGRLAEIKRNIEGEEIDLVKQFIKLYGLTDSDYDIQKLGDRLYEILKWREDNE
jgi:hypothetical protein